MNTVTRNNLRLFEDNSYIYLMKMDSRYVTVHIGTKKSLPGSCNAFLPRTAISNNNIHKNTKIRKSHITLLKDFP
jgi:hypothetical protein